MSPLARALRMVTVAPLKAAVILYRYTFSALLGHSCRFRPTCSEYALEALDRHGSLRGGWLAARRLVRCHPWGGWGYDPVPPAPPAVGPVPGPSDHGTVRQETRHDVPALAGPHGPTGRGA